MNTMTKMVLAVAMVATAMLGVADTKTTYRDAQGRIQGTKTTK